MTLGIIMDNNVCNVTITIPMLKGPDKIKNATNALGKNVLELVLETMDPLLGKNLFKRK